MSASSASSAASYRDIFGRPIEAKLALYTACVDDVVQRGDATEIVDFVTFLMQREAEDPYGRVYLVNDVLIRLLVALLDERGALEQPMTVEDLAPLVSRIVDLIRPKAQHFPQALFVALDVLAKCYQALGEFRQAALALSSFRYDDLAVNDDGSGDSSSSSSSSTGAASSSSSSSSTSVWGLAPSDTSAAATTNSTNSTAALTTTQLYEMWKSASARVQWHVQAAEFWLAVGESGSASQQVKRAHVLVPDVRNMPLLVLRFKTAYARVLDAERRFLDAAMRYLELCQNAEGVMSDTDLMHTLQLAVNCAILAKPGAPRSRVLAILYSDERCRRLTHHSMLEKMYLERIIKPHEVAQFEASLPVHQRASTSTGMSVLQNSVVEHNIVAVSRIYDSISIANLASLLGLTVEQCEQLLCTMIQQGRLAAVVDQVLSMVDFRAAPAASSRKSSSSKAKGGAGAGAGAVSAGAVSAGAKAKSGAGDAAAAGALNNAANSSSSSLLLQFDHRIEDTCLALNRIYDRIVARYPQYAVGGARL